MKLLLSPTCCSRLYLYSSLKNDGPVQGNVRSLILSIMNLLILLRGWVLLRLLPGGGLSGLVVIFWVGEPGQFFKTGHFSPHFMDWAGHEPPSGRSVRSLMGR